MINPPTIPSIGAAYGVVLKYLPAMILFNCGLPGKAVIVKVNAPRAIAPGINLLGKLASLNKEIARG